MTSELAQENSPVEPKLSVVKNRLDNSEDVDPTGPSPLMPSLSPQPLPRDAPVEETPIPAERRRAAKKMLVFGGQGVNQVGVDDGMKFLEDHRLGEVHRKSELGDVSPPSMSSSHPHKSGECFSPQEVKGFHEVKPNSVATTQVVDTSDLQNDSLCHNDTTASSSRSNKRAGGISTSPQRNILKRPNSASPAGSQRKRLRRTLGVGGGETSTNISLEPNGIQDNLETTLATALEEDYHQPDQNTVWSPPFFSGQPAAADDLNLFPAHEADDPESFLRRHGVDLFENSCHRQDLIEFCQNSLTTTHPSQFENSSNLNSNNNCSDDTIMVSSLRDGRHHATPANQFDSIVQRARARGFIVNDAMYFDGKQYVPIKVASNGRGKFRLLLPPDHPHRKGVDDEIPILKTFQMESSQEEARVDEDSFKESN